MRHRIKQQKRKKLSPVERRKARTIMKDSMYGKKADDWNQYYYSFNRTYRLSV